MSNKALIVGGGNCDLTGLDFSKYKFIMGCDGGTNYLSEVSEVPHAWIGDFDSIKPYVAMEMNMVGAPRHELPTHKDFTDMKAAVDFISKFNYYDEIDIYGGTGTRLDHSVGNMMLLFELCEMGIKGRIIDSNNIITAISADKEPVTLEVADIPDGWYVSFVPVGNCRGITIKGLKYKAENLELDINNVTQAISNEADIEKGEAASITLGLGRLLMFFSKD